VRISQTDGPQELQLLREIVLALQQGEIATALSIAGSNAIRAHYRFWGKPGDRLELPTLDAFLPRLRRSFRIAIAPRISRIECGNFMVNTLA